MRKLGTLLMVFTVILSLVVPSFHAEASNKTFTDVARDQEGADAIYRLVDQNVIRGYEDGTFKPYNHVTREHAAVILARLLELNLPDSKEVSNYYDDVKANADNAARIAAITKSGIMKGSDRKFNPYNNLTREQMATILVNGFDLLPGDNNVNINLDNVDPSHRNNVQTIANLGITNQFDDYRPHEYISRVQFALMLEKVIDDGESIRELLKEVFANEQQLESYEMKANVNFGLDLPELAENSPEAELISEMFKDINIDITGAYQKDPMLMEANVAVTMQIDPQINTTLSIPVIMSEDKMWMKLPQIPGEELPEQLADKFIEIDLNELEEFQGQPTPDMDIQLQLAVVIQNLFIDHFADDYYSKVAIDSYDVPEGVNAKHIVKFNLSNEDLEPFVTTLMTVFLPEVFDVLKNPEYAGAMGLTEEEIEEVQEEFKEITQNIDEIISMIKEVLHINTYEEYIVINDQNIIVNNVLNLDIDLTADDLNIGLTLSTDQLKSNINGDVKIDIPHKDDTISFEELLESIGENVPLI